MYSPEAESSPAPSSAEPQMMSHGERSERGSLGLSNKPNSRTSSFEIENLLKTAEQVWLIPRPDGFAKISIFFYDKILKKYSNLKVTGFCRSPQETRKSSPTGSVASSVSNAMLTPSRQLSDAEKLRKVILELVETERTYVKVINSLLSFGSIFENLKSIL